MSDLQSKTDEELNRMLAELCGYEEQRKYGGSGAYVSRWLLKGVESPLPRYCAFLDEVAKVEAGLTDEQHNRFRHNLRVITSGADIKFMAFRELISATARQRTIALIQTLQP